VYQKALVRRAWTEAGFDAADDPRLAEFLQYFDQAPGNCWAEIAQVVRDQYPEYLEGLAAAVWETGDPLLRLNLARAADLDRYDERALLVRFIEGSDPQHDAAVLRVAAATDHLSVSEAVTRKRETSAWPA
jgi:hypothetical protein